MWEDDILQASLQNALRDVVKRGTRKLFMRSFRIYTFIMLAVYVNRGHCSELDIKLGWRKQLILTENWRGPFF
jgi:hypothetical protein